MHTSGADSMFTISPLMESGKGTANSFRNCFKIIYVSSGVGACNIDESVQIVEAGQLFCIVPDCVHHFIPYPGACGHIITFSEAFLTQTAEDPEGFHAVVLLLRFSLYPVVTLQPDALEELPGIAGKMAKEYTNYYRMRFEILRRYLQIYLIHVLRRMETPEGAFVPPNVCVLIRKFTTLLEISFREKKMVADYARQLGVSANYLNCMVKKYSGYSVSHHIRQRVVLEAKRKAIYSGFSMKEIAYDLGFEDTAHFSKYFKNVAGNNFSSFKKALSSELFVRL